MADSIAEYLRELEQFLRSGLPQTEIEPIIIETDAHLHDLKEELGDELKAIQKFGASQLFADRILKDRNKVSKWRASIGPLAVLVGGTVLALLISLSGWTIREPFSSTIPAYYVIVLLPFAFAFACFKARQLIPLQLGLFLLFVSLARVCMVAPRAAVDTTELFGSIQAKEVYSVFFANQRYVFFPDSDIAKFAKVEETRLASYKMAMSDLNSEAKAISAAIAHLNPNDEYRRYPLPGEYVQRAVQSPLPGELTQVSEGNVSDDDDIPLPPNAKETDSDLDTRVASGLSNAARYWTPANVDLARRLITLSQEGAKNSLAAATQTLKETRLQRLDMALLVNGMVFLDHFLYFFGINLFAYGAVMLVEWLKRLRRNRVQAAN